MRRLTEIVIRREAKAFAFDRECRDQIALRFMAQQHPALAGTLGLAEVDDRKRFARWQEGAGHTLGPVSEIRGHFDQAGRIDSRTGNEPASGVDGEARCVMVGVSAFIGMRDDQSGTYRGDESGDPLGNFVQMKHRLLIDERQIDDALGCDPDDCQRVLCLLPTRRGIGRAIRKGRAGRIGMVVWRAIRHMHHTHVAPERKVRAGADHLVVGMRRHQ